MLFRATFDRADTVALSNGLAVYGGFLGTAHAGGGETLLSERDLDGDGHPVNETVLSGDLLGDDTPGLGNVADNALHVVTAVGTDASAIPRCGAPLRLRNPCCHTATPVSSKFASFSSPLSEGGFWGVA